MLPPALTMLLMETSKVGKEYTDGYKTSSGKPTCSDLPKIMLLVLEAITPLERVILVAQSLMSSYRGAQERSLAKLHQPQNTSSKVLSAPPFPPRPPRPLCSMLAEHSFHVGSETGAHMHLDTKAAITPVTLQKQGPGQRS